MATGPPAASRHNCSRPAASRSRRSGRSTGSGTTTYEHSYDGNTIFADLNGSGSVTTLYVTAGASGQIYVRIDGGTLYWMVQDRLGSVREVINASGMSVLDAITYDAFGNLSETNAAYRGNYGFTGFRLDSVTGYYVSEDRWYNPQTGQWIEVDPINVQGGLSNFRSYVGNNGINGTDPNGLSIFGSIFDSSFLDPFQFHNADHSKKLNPPSNYSDLIEKKLFKVAEGLYGLDTAEYNDFTKKYLAGDVYAGLDIGPTLKKGAEVLANDIRAMSNEQRTAITNLVFSLKPHGETGVVAGTAWDITQMYNTEKHESFASEKYGTGPARIFVTVNGEVHFAGAVNYFFWGRLNRLLWESEMTSEDWRKYNTLRVQFGEQIGHGGFRFVQTEQGMILPPKEGTNLHKAIGLATFYRITKSALGGDAGIAERVAWIKAGWFNDLSYATPFKLNKFVKPSPELYNGHLTWRISAGSTSLYYKAIKADGTVQELENNGSRRGCDLFDGRE